MIYPPAMKLRKKGCRLIVYIEGEKYNMQQVADYIGVAVSTVERRRYKAKTSGEFLEWIRDRAWLNMRGLAVSTKITIFKRGEERYTLQDIEDISGLTRGSAASRGYKWQKGNLSTKNLLKKGDRRYLNRKSSDTVPPPIEDKELSERKKVRNIPVGSWEQKMLQKHNRKYAVIERMLEELDDAYREHRTIKVFKVTPEEYKQIKSKFRGKVSDWSTFKFNGVPVKVV